MKQALFCICNRTLSSVSSYLIIIYKKKLKPIGGLTYFLYFDIYDRGDLYLLDASGPIHMYTLLIKGKGVASYLTILDRCGPSIF